MVVTPAPAAESITLVASARVVTYGGSVLLRGVVANGGAAQNVTISASPQAGKTIRSVLTVTTTASGAFSVRVRPVVQTVYVASTAKSSSTFLAINVRPRLRLGLIGRTRGIVRVSAARSFVHRYVLLQVWQPGRHVWVTMKRVRLTRSTAGISPTIVTTASFRVHVRHGSRLRVLMPRNQTVPGYVYGVSNIVCS